MPIAAGVECHGFVGAVVALLDARTERGGLASADVSENSKLVAGKDVAPLIEKFLFVLAKDIGDFEPMSIIFAGRPPGKWASTGENRKGLA